MATTTINGVFFTYPDDPVLIFNPCLVEVGYAVARVQIYISGYRVTYAARGGQCRVDIREYLQSEFKTLNMGGDLTNMKSELGKSVGITIIALDSDNTVLAQLEENIFCVWGGTAPGETFENRAKLTMFVPSNAGLIYPFTVGYYFSAAVDVDIYYYDAGGVKTLYNTVNVTSKGMWNINTNIAYTTKRIILSKNGYPNIVYCDIHVVNDREGVYLRWVDRHGFWRYWLFKGGDPQRTAASVFGVWNRIDYDDWEKLNHWTKDSGRHQSYTRNDVLPVCAPLVKQDTFDFLQDVTTSPCVDMVIGFDALQEPIWVNVMVEPGTYTKDCKKPEQDFLLNVIMPEIPIQSL